MNIFQNMNFSGWKIPNIIFERLLDLWPLKSYGSIGDDHYNHTVTIKNKDTFAMSDNSPGVGDDTNDIDLLKELSAVIELLPC